jgi:hypothetical protein
MCDQCSSPDVHGSCLTSDLPKLLLVYLKRDDERSIVAPDLYVNVANVCESNPNINLRNTYGKCLLFIVNILLSYDSILFPILIIV